MTTTTIRPNANWDGASGFTISGGGTAHGAVSDNSDATYLTRTSATVPASYVAEFGTFTLSASERITSVNLKARVLIGTTGSISFSIGVITDRNGHGVYYSAPISKQNTLAMSTIDLAFNLPQSPDGTEWDQTALDNLVVQFTDLCVLVGDLANLYELYLDVITAPVATVTVNAPTGAITDTSFPSVTWTYAQADGVPQSAYEIKIFDSATYGAVGFDPDTSTASVETGIVSSANNGQTLEGDLENSTTYRAYVRVASLVNGANYFSDWSYSGFSLAIDAPASPTVSAIWDADAGAVAVTIFGRTNMLSANQADIETDTTGWVALANCAIARSLAQHSSGVASLSLTASAAGDMSAQTTLATAFPVTAGNKFSAIASFKAGTTGRTCYAGIRWLDSSGTLISTDYGTGVADSSAGFTTPEVTATAPPTAVTAEVVLKVASAGSGEVHYADEIAFHAGDTPIWTRGGFGTFSFAVSRTDDGGITYTDVRTSPVSASTSQIAIVNDYEIPLGTIVTYRAKARAVI